MTTKDAALALALDALEEHDGNYAQSNASAARVNAAITAIKQAQQTQEPVYWKHDCAVLLMNNVELWIDRCPHCGKPRCAAPKQAEPVNCDTCAYHYKDTEQKPCRTCTHRGDLADNFEARVTP